MDKKDNKKYIFLDIWGTLLFNNKNSSTLNIDRAKILYNATKYKDILYWSNEIEKEINEFKIKELDGKSIRPIDRIKKLLAINNSDTNMAKFILEQFDNLIVTKYKPELNKNLIYELLEKDNNIILMSNTGLTSKIAVIKLLKNYNIKNKFIDMFFSEDYEVCKPSILFYMLPIIKYQLNVKDIIMYGDNKIMDLEPCNKIGIKCIIKKWDKEIL